MLLHTTQLLALTVVYIISMISLVAVILASILLLSSDYVSIGIFLSGYGLLIMLIVFLFFSLPSLSKSIHKAAQDISLLLIGLSILFGLPGVLIIFADKAKTRQNTFQAAYANSIRYIDSIGKDCRGPNIPDICSLYIKGWQLAKDDNRPVQAWRAYERELFEALNIKWDDSGTEVIDLDDVLDRNENLGTTEKTFVKMVFVVGWSKERIEKIETYRSQLAVLQQWANNENVRLFNILFSALAFGILMFRKIYESATVTTIPPSENQLPNEPYHSDTSDEIDAKHQSLPS
jgi:hypothetical protein